MPELFSILTFDYNTAENIDITAEEPDWQDVLTLTTPDREAGQYLAMFSLQFTMNSTSSSFLYRFSLDGGNTWGPTYQKEVKDRSNTEVIEVFNVLDHTGGAIDIRMQASKESGADATVLKAFMSVERKQ